jgi:NitT/TauT family transport system permease protein
MGLIKYQESKKSVTNPVYAGVEGFILKISGIVLLALLWEILSRTGFLDPQFFPSFFQTILGIGSLFTAGLLIPAVVISLWRAFTGLLIAVAIGIPLGLFLGRRSKDVEECFNPLFRMFSQVSPFSLMPIFILFFGIGEGVKLGVVAWVCLWPVFFNALEGSRNIDPMVIKTARAMATTRGAMIFKILLPGAAASLFAGLRLGLEMSFIMLIAAEMVGASSGLGFLLHVSSMSLQFVWMYASILLTVLLGFGMDIFLKYIYGKVFFWREELILAGGSQQKKRRAFTIRELCFTGAFILLIFILGIWQSGESKKELQNFGRAGHSHAPIGQFLD